MYPADLAKRVYDHTFKLDPIVRSLLDTDIYKLLMLQMIRREYPGVQVTFSLLNRSRHVRLTELISETELRDQLDHARTLTLSRRERVWLTGNTFYGKERLFDSEFIAWLSDYRLPDYDLRTVDGQFEIDFSGDWSDITLWEIPVLAIISELRSRAALRHYGRFELDVIYARAKAKLWEKVERLRRLDGLSLADFGTRRRHSFLWQNWCAQAMKEGLGDKFIGTSNVLLAMEHDLEAIGTNAHELPMVEAAISNDDDELRQAPYEVLKKWRNAYEGNLLVALPDAFGTTSFLRHAPGWLADWRGFRIDSKDPAPAALELIEWWHKRGVDPKNKMLIFSDGLEIDMIESLHKQFSGQVQAGFGWGTNLSNDFRNTAPDSNPHLDAFSLVCKVTMANGRPTVKLSDNLNKATGDLVEIQRYLEIFGDSEISRSPVEV
jgi:nicotinate phosphoribosyltransferase